jgi:hypothetical protein
LRCGYDSLWNDGWIVKVLETIQDHTIILELLPSWRRLQLESSGSHVSGLEGLDLRRAVPEITKIGIVKFETY